MANGVHACTFYSMTNDGNAGLEASIGQPDAIKCGSTYIWCVAVLGYGAAGGRSLVQVLAPVPDVFHRRGQGWQDS